MDQYRSKCSLMMVISKILSLDITDSIGNQYALIYRMVIKDPDQNPDEYVWITLLLKIKSLIERFIWWIKQRTSITYRNTCYVDRKNNLL